MKKIYSLLLILAASYSSFAQTVFSENFGTTAPSASPYPFIDQYTGYQNPVTMFNVSPSGNGSVRGSGTLSSGYAGASGGSHVYLSSSGGVGQKLQINGINTSAYSAAGLQLSFGYLKNLASHPQLVVEKSTDGGTTWTSIPFTDNTTTSWTLVTIAGGQIPSSANLILRFTNPTTAAPGTDQIRIDDVKVININAGCGLALGIPSVMCNQSTYALDTYTATIPYTGGTPGTYTITPSSGTVGGDNPATVAAGNIIVSGISEGTNFTLHIVNGSCTYDANGNSPECKPINSLPYIETFPYAAGSSLGSSQKWTNINSGDDIVGAPGSLSYSGMFSADNSVIFSGSGVDCFTPFTNVTSGTFYASFIMKVIDLSNVINTTPETYFFGLSNSSQAYRGRIFLKVSSGQYSLGLDSVATTSNYESALRNPDDVVLVVIGYDFNSNLYKLWVNPNMATLTASTPASLSISPTNTVDNFGGIILRQDGADITPTMIFDELRVSTTISGLLSARENNMIAGLKIHPNPVSNGTLFIETAANADKTVTIFDILGKQLLNTTTSNNVINVASLHAGVYIVNITEEGKTASRKLVIQ